ncbi:alkaline phosphatase [Sphingosinicella sp. CPCC 101087]|uniref:alkaline phosphatase D family protein n=1 Tax=Sphingosinicella sp. CPCC 101087 TaxID=2497754 RepID=UPI00101B8293|nr:alkaline phosphatase D family protein [Sphingosinicella sp. CPCC 101087]
MLNRRQFAASAAALLAAPALLRAQTMWRNYPFSLGIASGDPAPDGFVIWTRLAPDPLEPHGGMGMGAMPVKWEVAGDERFQSMVAQGEAQARPELAHSVHVEVTGLQPDRPYWYRFEAGGERTIRGRARTLPDPASAPQALRFGVAGCQNFEDGLYTAYRHLAREDLAFVFHYGDYIYEYRGDPLRPQHWTGDVFVPVRQHAGQLLFSIDDYRRRYAQYKADADLQRAHAAHAFFTTFDDHEVDNNWVAAIDHRDTPPEVFRLRRAAAFQAWYEHMPVRRASFPNAAAIQAYRSARFGNLAELNFLDTRQYRSDQPCDDGFKPVCADVRSAEATMLGAEQEAWLARNLQRRDVRWNCLAQQVMMMSVDRRRSPNEAPARIMNMDTWAAYEGPRQRLFARLRGLDNVVVLTGDEHQNWAGLLHDDRDRPIAAEFVSTSISSGGDGQNLRPGSDTILANNPQLKFVNDQRGYLTCDVTPDAWRTNFMVVDRVSTPDGALSKRATLAVPHGQVDLLSS